MTDWSRLRLAARLIAARDAMGEPEPQEEQ